VVRPPRPSLCCDAPIEGSSISAAEKPKPTSATSIESARSKKRGPPSVTRRGILWAALALCVLGALSYDILYWLEGW